MKIRGTGEKTQANTVSLETCSEQYSVVLRKLNPNLVEVKPYLFHRSLKKVYKLSNIKYLWK